MELITPDLMMLRRLMIANIMRKKMVGKAPLLYKCNFIIPFQTEDGS